MLPPLDRAAGVSLRDILPRCRFWGGDSVRISSCCDDPRLCRPGDLYAALVNGQNDGHDYISDAVRRGAAAILVERPVAVNVPTCVVKDTRTAFARVCHALAGDPCQQLQTVGISGTQGKTVTSLLITSILESAGAAVGILNSIGYCDGHRVKSAVPSLYSPPELARWLGAIRDHGCTHAVLESSSTNLATRRMHGVSLDVALLTNVRRANLSLHGSVRNYRQAEKRLFSLLKPEGFAVLNADDPATPSMLSKLSHPAITFGMSQPAEITGEILEQHHGEQTFLLRMGHECVPVRTAITGAHHVANCLAAAAVTRVLGVDLLDIARGLEAVDSIPGRMESIQRGQPFPVYLETTTSPEGLASALKSLRGITSGRIVCVMGVSADHPANDRAQFGRTLERLADVGIVTGPHPSIKLPLPVAHDILDGYDRPAIAHLIPDRVRAIEWAIRQTRPGDVLCITGQSTAEGPCQSFHHSAGADRQLIESLLTAADRPQIYRFAA